MKKSEIKTILKFAKNVWIGSFVFWIIETIVFLIIEGWHLKATHPVEIYCDKTVSLLWQIALFITVYVFATLLFNLKSK